MLMNTKLVRGETAINLNQNWDITGQLMDGNQRLQMKPIYRRRVEEVPLHMDEQLLMLSIGFIIPNVIIN